MIEKEVVARLAKELLASSGCYLVDVTIRPGNLIVVEIDHDTAVGIDDCVALSRYIEDRLDRDVEDYELEVGSAGLGSPLKIFRQYLKNIGNEMEVSLKNGLKMCGVLKSADEKGVTVSVAKQIKPEGAKRKETVLEDYPFKYEEIKYIKNIITFN
ncbi:MAG: ribosome assembly cofactor RimP [Tannerella sp.]|nr:ribosome assembly cofactor RimP [Tannerella sp.]